MYEWEAAEKNGGNNVYDDILSKCEARRLADKPWSLFDGTFDQDQEHELEYLDEQLDQLKMPYPVSFTCGFIFSI